MEKSRVEKTMKFEENPCQFLEILYEILHNPLYSKILEWKTENIFEIKNIDLFTSIVLPRFYENESYETFISQLYLCNFIKIQETTTSQFFSHPNLRKSSNHSLFESLLIVEENGNQETTTMTTTTISTNQRKQGAAFLEKLFDILEDSAYEEYISWCDDGKSVLVKKVEEFSQVVLPKYYKHNNFQSFVRQLNMYNFNKTSHDANWREFKQPLFRKGKRHLLSLITRKTQQKTQTDRDRSDTFSEKSSTSVGKQSGGSILQKLPSRDLPTGNPSNGDLIAMIFELQNKIYHMESRLNLLEEHLIHCPNASFDCNGHEDNDPNSNSPSSRSFQSLTSPTSFFPFHHQTFRDTAQLSLPSTRQNSESGSMCSEVGNLVSRTRTAALETSPTNAIRREKALRSFDGAYRSSLEPTNRLEGVALQRRNRSISIGYDTFEAKNSDGTAFESGVDAILTAAAAVAQRVSTNENGMLDHSLHGRPLKKLKTVSESPLMTTNNADEGSPLQRKASLSAPFQGLMLSKMASIG